MALTVEQKRKLHKLSISNEGLFSDEKNLKGTLNPTIVIGIGGLGCMTLDILKKKLIMNIDDIPNVKLLAIDSDENDLYSYEFLNEGETLSLFDPNISRILCDDGRNIPLKFDKDILRELHGVKIDNNGTHGRKQLGRIILWCGSAYHKLKTKLSKMIASAETALSETQRLRQAKVEIILIAGVSGGTGGGTLIDIAYLVHRIMAETHRYNYSCSAYMYTPDVQFSELGKISPEYKEHLKRNGYETMKEIDYYMNLVNSHGVYSIGTCYGNSYKAKCNIFTDCTIVTGNMQTQQSVVSKLTDALVDYLSDSEIHSKQTIFESNRITVSEAWRNTVTNDAAQFPKEVNYSFRLLDYSVVSVSTDEFRTYFIGKAFQALFEKLTHIDKVDGDMVQSVLSRAHLKDEGTMLRYARSTVGGIVDMSEILQPNEYPSKSSVRDCTDMTYELYEQYAKMEAEMISAPPVKERLKQEAISIIRSQIDDIGKMYGPYFVVELITHIIGRLNNLSELLVEQADKQRDFATCEETKEVLRKFRDAATRILAGSSRMKSYVDFNREIAVSAIINTTFYNTLSIVVQEITDELARRDKKIWEFHTDMLTEISTILEKDVREIIDTQKNENRIEYSIYSLSEDRSEKIRRYLEALADSQAVDFLFKSFKETFNWSGAERFEINATDSSVLLAEIRAIFTGLVREFIGTDIIEKFVTVAYSPNQLYADDIDYIWVNNGIEKDRALKSAAMEIFRFLNMNNNFMEGVDSAFQEKRLINTRTIVTLANAPQLSKELSVLCDESQYYCSKIRSKILNKYVFLRNIWNVSLYMIREFWEYEQENYGTQDIYIGEYYNQNDGTTKLPTIKEVLTLNFSKNGRNKLLHVMAGDICDIIDSIDLLVCPAFKNNYSPSPETLIGALYCEKNISVYGLSENPELDLRNVGCWLSKETGTNFSRIACVEILPQELDYYASDTTEKLLRSTFSNLHFLLEHACIDGISVRNIVMPILGVGNQMIDINYIAPVLLSRMRQALESFDQLTDIYIYERNPDKAMKLSDILSHILESDLKESPDVFISYSSKQDVLAHRIFNTLSQKGISCWIAPDSIPPGSSYIDEISEGLGITQLTVLVLTPDAEKSRWVKKEIGASIGAGHIIIPFQNKPYQIGKEFRFLLDGEQILEAWREPGDALAVLAEHVSRKLVPKEK